MSARPEEMPRGAFIGGVIVKGKHASFVPASPGRVHRAPVRVDPPHVRGHLLTALAWAAGAFAVLALLSSELARLLGPFLGDIGMSGAALCVLLSGLAYMVVSRIARRLDARERTDAQVLLFGTTLVSALLVSFLATAFVSGDALEFIPIAVLNVAGSAIAALIIAVTIPTRFLRGLVLSSIVLGPFLVLAPEHFWLGLVCAFLLIVAVEVVLHHAREMVSVPEPALAACLVAGIVALPVLVFYVAVRSLLCAAVRSTYAVPYTRERAAARSRDEHSR